MKLVLGWASSLLLISAMGSLQAQEPSLSEADARAAIANFYDALNAAPSKDAAALVLQGTAEGWESCGTNEQCKARDKVAGAIAGFGKAIPDLKWEIKEVLVSGNRVVVRGEGTGTPAGEFMGVPHSAKSFKLMSIDIHQVQDGKLTGKTYHIEDWAGALGQLRAQ